MIRIRCSRTLRDSFDALAAQRGVTYATLLHDMMRAHATKEGA